MSKSKTGWKCEDASPTGCNAVGRVRVCHDHYYFGELGSLSIEPSERMMDRVPAGTSLLARVSGMLQAWQRGTRE